MSKGLPTAGLWPGAPVAVGGHQLEQEITGGVDTGGQAEDKDETSGLVDSNKRSRCRQLKVGSTAALALHCLIALEWNKHFAVPKVDHSDYLRLRETARRC